MITEDEWADMSLVAAAGSVSFVELSDERAIDAAQRIIDNAPEHLADDFRRCCAYHVYRTLLIEAVANNSLDTILVLQNNVLSLLDG